MAKARSLHIGPPFRADHVGSFLRPKELFDKRTLFEEGKCTIQELRAAEDIAIQRVVKMQQDLGLKTITDGEMRRGMFFEGVFDNLEGMQFMPARPMSEFKDYMPHIAMMKKAGVPTDKTIYCSGKIRRTKPFYVDQFKYTASLVAPEDVKNVKINVCSPSWFHQRHGSDMTYNLAIYKNDDEYFDDLGIAYRAEFQDLYDNGCRHIQIDDPTFCFFCTDFTIDKMKEMGVDSERLLDTYIRAINVCTQGRPRDLTVSVHMCRGNYMGAHFCDGGYDRIAKKVFRKLDVDTFYLEYDDERSGSFSPLKDLPPNKSVVLGIVTTKNGKLESAETLKRRIDEAARAILDGGHHQSLKSARKQICISPQCGFASVWQGNPITEEDQTNKLRLLVKTAKNVWND